MARAAADPVAAALPVLADKLDTVPVVVAVPFTEAAPAEMGPRVNPVPAAAPLAEAPEEALCMLSALPVPELAAFDMVFVPAFVNVVTPAIELVAVATPAASKTASAIRLFFMIISLVYPCNPGPPGTVFGPLTFYLNQSGNQLIYVYL